MILSILENLHGRVKMGKDQQSTRKVSAVIVAAGTGSRMNMNEKKQFITIGGLPVIVHCLKVFDNCNAIDDIIVVINSDDIDYFTGDICKRFLFSKIKSVVIGGETRQQSVYNGLKAVDMDTGIVAIHDGARPFIREEEIIASIEAARKFGASCVAVPVKDTIKTVGKDGFVLDTPDRTTLWAVQTPQTFKYDIIVRAHDLAREKGLSGSDDAFLAEAAGYKVYIVEGSYDNIKITTREDLLFAEYLAGRDRQDVTMLPGQSHS